MISTAEESDESDDSEYYGPYTNTITNLINLPTKNLENLKELTRQARGGEPLPGKPPGKRQTSLQKMDSMFKTRHLRSEMKVTESDDEADYEY